MMYSLRKQIKCLEEDTDRRRSIAVESFAAAKCKVSEKITSPTAFGIAFLSGVLLTARRKKVVAKKNNVKPSAVSPTNFLSIISEASNVLMLVRYAEKFFKKAN